jgi:hypothetical protein
MVRLLTCDVIIIAYSRASQSLSLPLARPLPLFAAVKGRQEPATSGTSSYNLDDLLGCGVSSGGNKQVEVQQAEDGEEMEGPAGAGQEGEQAQGEQAQGMVVDGAR